MAYRDDFGSKGTLQTARGPVSFFAINALEKQGIAPVSKLPFSIKIVLESLLRNVNGYDVLRDDVVALAKWKPDPEEVNIPFKLARVILQDFTGVPAVADLAAMRGAMARLGGDPKKINPLVPVDLVIDHSVQVDYFGSATAFQLNVKREYERNRERYTFLKWAQNSLRNFRVVPPGAGIVHQVNLEHLSTVVMSQRQDGEHYAFPDTLVGTDSHTTMVNGLGVLGWGVGGIEAEAVMLGQPYYMLAPKVVGVRLTGELPEGATATDLVLTVTQMLRKHGVVDKFVEFFGPGISKLSVADRATIANMAPEYGATIGLFPVDQETLTYLHLTGREPWQVELVERYTKEVGLFWTDTTPDPVFSEVMHLDMSKLEPSLAGPKRPQDRVSLREVKHSFRQYLTKPTAEQGFALQQKELDKKVMVRHNGTTFDLAHGSVVIAAITSCTNTSNPSVMIGAGLLAKKATEAGLTTKPWVKTSLAPGSKVVTNYLRSSGLMPYLEALNFHLVGFGCTTCIGNSGPLSEDIAKVIEEGNLVAAAVLSGNRNFEGRIHPLTKANYLASPVLVVAYALAGRIDIDFASEPLGLGTGGRPVYLRDIWPTLAEVQETIRRSLDSTMFREGYSRIFDGDEQWQNLSAPAGDLYHWDATSTYIQEPPFFKGVALQVSGLQPIRGARVLAMVGDSVTTDHISPAGSISPKGSAGQYLISQGVEQWDFNSFGARRGNHEVMLRGTFGNARLKNLLLGGEEGWHTIKLPQGARTTIYDAAMQYQAEQVPLIVIAGKEYGTGSSRDWAAKGPQLMGVKAVIAESFERIHRSNLVGMGILPLEFKAGQSARSLGLTGRESYDILGFEQGMSSRQEITVMAKREDGSTVTFQALCRVDTAVEVDYYRNGGILPTVLRRLARAS